MAKFFSLLDSRRVACVLSSSACSFSTSAAVHASLYVAASSPASCPFRLRTPNLRLREPLAIRKPYTQQFCGASWNNCPFGVARSFLSGSDGKPGAPPPQPPAETAQLSPSEVLDATDNTVASLKQAASSSITWIHDSLETMLKALRERYDLPEYTPETIRQLLYTTFAASLAWLVMPKVFRMFHKYFEDGSYILLKRSEKVPYELSFWYSLEDPAKIFISILAFSQLSSLIAPTTIAGVYLYQIWKGAAVVALVWFLHRWKSNVFSRLFSNPNLGSAESERLHALEKISSMCLFVLGAMGAAETCGIAAQSILTVGGVGGVATAFAARDILGNILTGFALQFMKPFSIGDTIKAGNVEGQVVDIGLTSTQLLDLDKFPVAVPNSFFSSQAIVNKSRATWRAFTVKIPVQLVDYAKIPQITQDIRNMLKSHAGVTLQSGVPLCYASHIAGSSLEIVVLCNLTYKGREDFLALEQDITVQALKIITSSGAALGALP